jgi:hypothetical protein
MACGSSACANPSGQTREPFDGIGPRADAREHLREGGVALGPDGIERRVAERRGERVALHEGDAVGEAGAPRELPPDAYALVRTLEDRDVASHRGRDEACATDPAAHVQNRHAAVQPPMAHQPDGGRPPSGRRHLGDRQSLVANPGRHPVMPRTVGPARGPAGVGHMHRLVPHARAVVSFGRLRVPLAGVGAALLVANAFAHAVPAWASVAVFVALVTPYFRVPWPRRRAVRVIAPPVSGRWRAANSPATRVPSHGLHAYGQTFAIDLVKEPRPGLRWWPLARGSTGYPGFGAEIRAPADGIVVAVHDRERDHRARSSWPALAYFLLESMVRELLGPTRILGNHVVIDIGHGVYAAVAHLQRRSARVRPGEAVRVGDVVGRCGNSGSSTEPHVHLQLMDHRHPLLADGVPFTFAGTPVPRGGDALDA